MTDELALIQLADGSMTAKTATDPKRLASLYHGIEDLKTLADKLVLEEIQKSDLNIKKCAEHIKGIYISVAVDNELLRKMVKQTRTLEDFLETTNAFIHHRKDERYYSLLVKEFSNPEIEIDWQVWLGLLTHPDPYYSRVSQAIKQMIVQKVFELSPEEGILKAIQFLKRNYSMRILAVVLPRTKLPIKTWEVIEANTKEEEFKEIHKLAQEKINQK